MLTRLTGLEYVHAGAVLLARTAADVAERGDEVPPDLVDGVADIAAVVRALADHPRDADPVAGRDAPARRPRRRRRARPHRPRHAVVGPGPARVAAAPARPGRGRADRPAAPAAGGLTGRRHGRMPPWRRTRTRTRRRPPTSRTPRTSSTACTPTTSSRAAPSSSRRRGRRRTRRPRPRSGRCASRRSGRGWRTSWPASRPTRSRGSKSSAPRCAPPRRSSPATRCAPSPGSVGSWSVRWWRGRGGWRGRTASGSGTRWPATSRTRSRPRSPTTGPRAPSRRAG